MTIKEFYADRIIGFLKQYAPYTFDHAQKAIVRKHILAHIEYQTIVCIWNQGEIVGVCAFNISGNEADIIHCVVHPNYRFRKMLARMTKEGVLRYPFIETLCFERWDKYKVQKQHKINVNRLLQESITNGI